MEKSVIAAAVQSVLSVFESPRRGESQPCPDKQNIFAFRLTITRHCHYISEGAFRWKTFSALTGESKGYPRQPGKCEFGQKSDQI
jgi:hypothetical protein